MITVRRGICALEELEKKHVVILVVELLVGLSHVYKHLARGECCSIVLLKSAHLIHKLLGTKGVGIPKYFVLSYQICNKNLQQKLSLLTSLLHFLSLFWTFVHGFFSLLLFLQFLLFHVLKGESEEQSTHITIILKSEKSNNFTFTLRYRL